MVNSSLTKADKPSATSIMPAIEWKISTEIVAYDDALSQMEQRVDEIIKGTSPECVWLLEHPPLYTAGTSAQDADLISADRFPVYKTGRGGQYTYHGPGQRVAYVMLDLKKRNPDVRAYVQKLENWIIDTLKAHHITGETRAERVGVWVARNEQGAPDQNISREDKIAAIGVRVRRWVTFHGISVNLHPNLEHFSGIVPCGIDNYGVTSFADLGLDVEMAQLDESLRHYFELHFGPTESAAT